MLKKILGTICILLFFTVYIYGDNDEEEISDTQSADVEAEESTVDEDASEENSIIVVTGTKFEQDIDDTIEDVEVITAEDIEQSGAKNLAEAVEDIPGLIVTGHPTDTISIQGFDGDYVKFMIDGIEVSGNIGGAVAVYQIPTADIERIEIIKGASSALYGSDAIGGIINIITKKKKGTDKSDLTGSITQEFGSNLRTYTTGDIAYSNKRFSISGIGAFDFDSGKTEEKETSMAGTITQYLVPYNLLGTARLNANYYGDNGDVGIFGSFVKSDMTMNTTTYQIMDYNVFKLDTGLTGSISLGDMASMNGFASFKKYDLETNFTNYRTDSNSITDSDFMDVEAEVRAAYEPTISHSLIFGLNFTGESIVGDSFEGRKISAIGSLFAQDTWNIGAGDIFFVVPGARVDFSPPVEEDDSFIFQATPKLSLRYNATDTTIIRAAYGMGYKIPTLKQKYWIFVHPYAPGTGNFILYGNPDLKPETSQGFNISVEQDIAKLFTISASGYFNYVINLIDSEITDWDDENSRYIRTYHNVNKAITYGGDLSFQYNKDRINLFASYAYTGAKQYSESYEKYIDLESRVPHRVVLKTAYTIPKIETQVTLRGSWNSPQLVAYDVQYYSPDYLMFSLNISKKIWEDRLEFYCRADNLLNNTHFMESSYNETQEDYFELYDGIVVTIGGRLKL